MGNPIDFVLNWSELFAPLPYYLGSVGGGAQCQLLDLRRTFGDKNKVFSKVLKMAHGDSPDDI